MDTIFKMNLEDLPSSTPQVLQDCLSLFNSPTHESYIYKSYPLSTTNKRTDADIKYFQRVKAKNHFNYHKSKNTEKSTHIDTIESRMTVFDPYNHDSLIERLRTFNALNWNIPNDLPLNELKCARNGWKCVLFSLNNNTKNQLLCTCCNQLLILRFSDDDDDNAEFHKTLCDTYTKQIETDKHNNNCPWRNFETPLEGIYYPRPYLNSTNEILVRDYLKCLKNLMDNSVVLNEYSDAFDEEFTTQVLPPDFIRISNEWLLQRYFKENKENFSVMLDYTPPWFYKLALLGWSLHVQSFSRQVILLLICNKCNHRIFLNPTDIAEEKPSINLSSSKILTPCKFPVTNNIVEEDQYWDEEASEKVNPWDEHKSWCCNTNNVVTSLNTTPQSLHEFFVDLIQKSENSIGIDGEYIGEADMIVDESALDTPQFKRRKSFDINEGLERLSKLRKLYLIEE